LNEYINPRYTEVLGYTLEEINSMTPQEFQSLFHPDDWGSVQAHMQRVVNLKLGEIDTLKYRFKTKSGEWKWCLSNDGGFEYDEKGNLVSFIGSFLDITEEVATQGKLDSLEQSYKSLFEQALSAIAVHELIYDKEGKACDFVYLDGNKKLLEMYERKRSDIIGKRVTDLIPDFLESSPDLFEKFVYASESGKADEFEYFFASWGRWFLIKAFGHAKHGFVTITDDITDQKQMLNQITSERNLTRKILEHSAYGKIIYDDKGDCITANLQAAEIVGADREQLLQQNFHSIQSWKESGIYEDALHVVETGEPKKGETQLTSTFGKFIHIGYTLFRFNYDNRDHLGFNFSDITEQVRSKEILAESERRYRAMFHDNSSIQLILDPNDGNIVNANTAASEFYGYSVEELERINISEINTLNRVELLNVLERAVSGEKRYSQFKHKLASGEVRDVQVYSGRIRIDDKDLIYSTIHDNTSEVEARKKLERFARKLEDNNRELQQLTYIVSHDLKSPLVNLEGYTGELELAREQLKGFDLSAHPWESEEERDSVVMALQEDLPTAIGFIRKSVDRMNRYINSLLNLSRVGRIEFMPKNVDLDALVESIVASQQKNFDHTRISVETNNLGTVVTDDSMIEQILSNLISNAIKYSDPNRHNLVSISMVTESEDHIVKVCDTGKGIQEKNIEKIFAPFKRIDAGITEGEGMGLAFARAVIRKLGGRIWCTSEFGKGSCFYIQFPIAFEEEEFNG
jgi:PAS domain S-box-containing protein